jgi:superoxide dismutase
VISRSRVISSATGWLWLVANRVSRLVRMPMLVVDDHYRCIGLITVKDIEKQVAYPNAIKDEQGSRVISSATGWLWLVANRVSRLVRMPTSLPREPLGSTTTTAASG